MKIVSSEAIGNLDASERLPTSHGIPRMPWNQYGNMLGNGKNMKESERPKQQQKLKF
jgi:hypothetical protein